MSIFKIRNVTLGDIKQVYRLLSANRPYVGLNSRYTYLLLARDFSDTCLVAEDNERIIAFSSGYISPSKQDTFFNWEIVVDEKYRGNGLQKKLLLNQINRENIKYLEATVNPSNEAAKRNYRELTRLLKTVCHESVLFCEEDFENDSHEAEVLYRIGPFSRILVEKASSRQLLKPVFHAK